MINKVAANPLWYLIRFLGLPAVFLLLAGSYFSISISWFLVGTIFVFFSYRKPDIALSIFFVCLPVFGNRPCERQTHYLILFSSFLIIGLYANLLSNKYPLARFVAKLRTNSVVIVLIGLYLTASVISLLGLPVINMIVNSKADHWFVFKEILKVGEVTILTSATSVLYGIQAIMIGLYIFGTVRRYSMVYQYKFYLFAVVTGLFISIIVGLLDYFQLVDLSFYRISGTPDRLTSFFANSGWYAQYLAVSFPLISVLLLSRFKYRINLVLLILFMIIDEVALLFAMQRGAWVTYPVILVLLWITIYVAKDRFQGKSLTSWEIVKKHWFKVIVSIPLTISISLLVVFSLRDYRVTHKISPQDTAVAMAERAKTLTQSNDRLKFVKPALELWMLNPIYGGGGDSFGWQYLKEFIKEDGVYYLAKDKIPEGQYGTAHNMYLQTLVGRGILGLIFLVSFLLYLLVKLINNGMNQRVMSNRNEISDSIISIALAGSIIAVLIYGNVQEIFYSQPVHILFWVVVFMGAALVHRCKVDYMERKKKILARQGIIIIMLALVPVHFMNIPEVKQGFNMVLGKLSLDKGMSIDFDLWRNLYLFFFLIPIAFYVSRRFFSNLVSKEPLDRV